MKLCATQEIIITILTLIFLNTVLILISVPWSPPEKAGAFIALNAAGATIIMTFLSKLWSEQKTQKKLLIADLERLLSETRFATIDYCNGKIIKKDFQEPQSKYPSEVKKIYEKNGLILLRQHAKDRSEELQNAARDAMEDFHSLISHKLKTIHLEKSMDYYTRLAEKTYSFPRLCQAIFEEISGEKSGFLIQDGYLGHIDTEVARDGNTLDDLKSTVEALIKDEKLIENVKAFNESKVKLNTEEIFAQFRSQLNSVINQLKWNYV